MSRWWMCATSFGHESKPPSRAIASWASASMSGRDGSATSVRTARRRARAARSPARAARISSLASLRCCRRLREVDGLGLGTDDLLHETPVSASWAEERSLVAGHHEDRWAQPFPRTGGALQAPYKRLVEGLCSAQARHPCVESETGLQLHPPARRREGIRPEGGRPGHGPRQVLAR